MIVFVRICCRRHGAQIYLFVQREICVHVSAGVSWKCACRERHVCAERPYVFERRFDNNQMAHLMTSSFSRRNCDVCAHLLAMCAERKLCADRNVCTCVCGEEMNICLQRNIYVCAERPYVREQRFDNNQMAHLMTSSFSHRNSDVCEHSAHISYYLTDLSPRMDIICFYIFVSAHTYHMIWHNRLSAHNNIIWHICLSAYI